MRLTSNLISPEGYFPGETPDMFKHASLEALELIAQKSTYEVRRDLARREIERRAS